LSRLSRQICNGGRSAGSCNSLFVGRCLLDDIDLPAKTRERSMSWSLAQSSTSRRRAYDDYSHLQKQLDTLAEQAVATVASRGS
jgi:hypothetical protein